MDYAWILKCLGDVLDARDIVVTEIVLDPAQACFTRPARACDLPVLFVVYNNAG